MMEMGYGPQRRQRLAGHALLVQFCCQLAGNLTRGDALSVWDGLQPFPDRLPEWTARWCKRNVGHGWPFARKVGVQPFSGHCQDRGIRIFFKFFLKYVRRTFLAFQPQAHESAGRADQGQCAQNGPAGTRH